MATRDPVLARIAPYRWPRGGVRAHRVSGGYTLTSARTGAPVARLKPLPSGDRVEVLWWRRDAWGRPDRSAPSSPSTTRSPSSPQNRRSGCAPDLAAA